MLQNIREAMREDGTFIGLITMITNKPIELSLKADYNRVKWKPFSDVSVK